MAPRTVPLLLAAAILASGCLGALPDAGDAGATIAKEPIPDDWARRALPIDDDHDHYEPTHHRNISTSNFELQGWNPLVTDHYGRSAGGYLCGAATDTGERQLAVVHSFDSEVAFVLVDVTDPANPEKVGEMVMPSTSSRDVDITPEGDHVIVAVSTPQTPDAPVTDAPTTSGEARMVWRTSCRDEPVPVPVPADVAPEDNAPFPPGVLMVNVEDPSEPFVESHYTLPVLGAHSVYAGEADGEPIVIASVVNLAAAASNFYFFGITSTPAGDQLELYSTYADSPVAENAPLINGHNDAVVQEHPITDTTYAYLANWHQGMVILDISDPRTPTVVGRWSDNPAPNANLVSDGTGNIHEAVPLSTTWNGRHYTFVGQEILSHPSQTPTGWLHVLDTTDPSAPRKVADWTLPVDVEWRENLQFSTHYIDIVNRTVFMANYHAGVWAIDASQVGERPLLPSIGAYVPSKVSPEPPEDGSFNWTPTIMNVNALPDGRLVVWDNTSGVYTLRFDEDRPAPPKAPLVLDR